jgi:hypothetical protein
VIVLAFPRGIVGFIVWRFGPKEAAEWAPSSR